MILYHTSDRRIEHPDISFSRGIANVKDEHDMLEIRNLISEYFSNKALDAMDRLCDKGKLSNETIESWQTEHMRTPYTY